MGAIALTNGDRLTINLLRKPDSDDVAFASHKSQFGPTRGQSNTLTMLKFLESQQPEGQTEISRSIRDYSRAANRPGLAFLISDLFSSDSYQDGLNQLQGRGYEVTVIHLLAPEEYDPQLAGDLRLVDVETGSMEDVSIDVGMRSLYQRRLESWLQEISTTCQKRGIHYLGVNTVQSWEGVVLQEMRKVGVVR